MKQRGDIAGRTMPKAIGGEATLPLFAARELADVHSEREVLLARIKTLPPKSHRRVELEFRLREMTTREIAIGLSLSPRTGGRTS